MSFYGTEFIFDGTSSYEFGLCLYYQINNATQSDTEFASNVKMMEDRLYRRSSSYCYGGIIEDSLEFKLVFGVTEERKATLGHFDRWEMQKIASWLTGHRGYKWLHILQDDLTTVRYWCYITDLKTVEIGSMHWGFECTVTCDSPFGYLMPQVFEYSVNGTQTVVLHSRSSSNDPYFPVITYQDMNMDWLLNFSIQNVTDSNRKFELNGVPSGAGDITLDCAHGVLSCESDLNLYSYCNFKFPRLLRGDNELILKGNGIFTFTCEFPVNVGG